MRPLLGLLCLALAVTGSLGWWDEQSDRDSYKVREQVFRSGSEYVFAYDGQLTSGIPGASKQYSGTRIRAIVKLVFKGQHTLLKLSDVRVGRLNSHIPEPRMVLPWRVFEETPIEPQLKEQLELPVQFTYTDGMVDNVVFERREKSWSANIKRGVMNLLQVNLKEQNRVNTEENRLENSIPTSSPHEARFYKTMEASLEGECETLYTVTRECGWNGYSGFSTVPCLNVTKSVNFEKCNKRPQIKYNFRFSDPCPTCDSKYSDDEKFLKSSTVAKFNISGDRESFLIQSARVESHYTFVPFNNEESVIASYVNQTLVLLKSGPIETQISQIAEPLESDSDLVYTLDWDVEKEKFFMEGDRAFLEQTPYSEVPDKINTIADILRVFTERKEHPVDEQAAHQFSRLVTVLRMSKREEIERVHEAFYTRQHSDFDGEQQKKIRDIWTDALALAGTKDTISHLISKIRTQEIPSIRAALAIKNLINTRVVSKEMIHELLSLAESEVAERSPFLKQSIWLTVGSMINALCMPNEDVLALESKVSTEQLCSIELRKTFAEKLFRKLESSNKWEDRVLLLKAVGNAGLDVSVVELEKIIRNVDRQYPTYMRKEAILALRQLREVMPKKVHQILMPVFMNRFEKPEIRIVAVYMILKTLPERPILDQLAKSVYAEPSQQVASFVFSHLNALANSTNPCQKKISHDARLSLRFAKAIHPGLLYSKFVNLPLHSDHYKVGMDLNTEWVFSNRSYIPRHVATTLNANFLGFWHKYLLTIGLDAENLESIVYKYLGERGILYEQPWEQIVRDFFRQSRDQEDFNQDNDEDKYDSEEDKKDFDREDKEDFDREDRENREDRDSKEEEERFSRHPRSTERNSFKFERELKDIFNLLKVSPREEAQQAVAFLYMKYKDQEYGFLPLMKWRQMFSQDKLFSVNGIVEKLRNGVQVDFHQATILHEMMYKIPTSLGLPLAVTVSIPTVATIKGRIQVTMESFGTFVVDAQVKPSLVSTLITKVESWSPIVNHGVKVQAQAKLSYPFNTKLHVDLKSETKQVKLTLQVPKTQQDLIVLETRPSTYTIVWPKTIQKWEEPEEKTVHGEEINRQYTFDKSFGRQSLGMELRVRGRANWTPYHSVSGTPFSPLSGPNKIVVSYEPTEDTPSELEMKLSTQLFRHFQEEAFRPEFRDFKPLESLTSEEEERDEEFTGPDFKTFQTSQASENFLRLELIAKSSRPRTLVAEIRHKFDSEMRYNKIVAKVERSPLPESERWEACFEAEMLHPKDVNTLTEMVGKKVISTARLNWGARCSSENFITLKVEAGRSNEQMKLERQTPYYKMYENCQDKTVCSPVSIYQYLNVLGQLKKYKIDVEFRNVPASFKNVTSKALRMVKNYFYQQTDVNDIHVENPTNRLRAEITLDALTNQRVNITLRTPKENVKMFDLPLPVPFAPLNTRRSAFRSFFDEITEDKLEAQCHIGSRHIETFDGQRYTVPLSDCYSVVAKDCSSQPKFVVMVKKQTPESELKKVKIMTRNHKIVLTSTSESYEQIKVEVNGEEYKPTEEATFVTHHGHAVVKMVKRESFVEITLPETGVKIFFDGFAVDVKLSQMYRGQQCGLCGHFDLEESDEFRGPENRQYNDVRRFFASYLLKDSECSKYPETESLCSDSRCEYKPFWETSKDIETEDETLRSTEPVRRTKVVEHRDKLCFSEEPIPTCSTHTEAVKKVQREVRFRCVRRDSELAEELHRDSFDRVIRSEELAREEVRDSFTQTQQVPTVCKPYYYESQWN